MKRYRMQWNRTRAASRPGWASRPALRTQAPSTSQDSSSGSSLGDYARQIRKDPGAKSEAESIRQRQPAEGRQALGRRHADAQRQFRRAKPAESDNASANRLTTPAAGEAKAGSEAKPSAETCRRPPNRGRRGGQAGRIEAMGRQDRGAEGTDRSDGARTRRAAARIPDSCRRHVRRCRQPHAQRQPTGTSRTPSTSSKSPTSRKLSTTPSRSSKTCRKTRAKPAFPAQSASRRPRTATMTLERRSHLRRSIYFIRRVSSSYRCLGNCTSPQPPNLLHMMPAMHQVKLPPLRPVSGPRMGWSSSSCRCAQLFFAARHDLIHLGDLRPNLGQHFLRRHSARTATTRRSFPAAKASTRIPRPPACPPLLANVCAVASAFPASSHALRIPSTVPV